MENNFATEQPEAYLVLLERFMDQIPNYDKLKKTDPTVLEAWGGLKELSALFSKFITKSNWMTVRESLIVLISSTRCSCEVTNEIINPILFPLQEHYTAVMNKHRERNASRGIYLGR